MTTIRIVLPPEDEDEDEDEDATGTGTSAAVPTFACASARYCVASG